MNIILNDKPETLLFDNLNKKAKNYLNLTTY